MYRAISLLTLLTLMGCSVQDYSNTLDDGRETEVVLVRDAIAGSFNVRPTVVERDRIREEYRLEFPRRANEICPQGSTEVKGPATHIKGTAYGSSSVTTSTTITCK